MKELLFRAWDHDLEQWADPSNGDFEVWMDDPKLFSFDADTDEYTIEQYIFLKDSKDERIFEGDIVEWRGHEVCKGKQIRPKRKIIVELSPKKLHSIWCLQQSVGIKIIGNIHENKILL